MASKRQRVPDRPPAPRFQRSGDAWRKFARSTQLTPTRSRATSPTGATRWPKRSTRPTATPPPRPSPRCCSCPRCRPPKSPLRGLTDGELIETLVDPLLEVSEIKGALSRLQGQAWYLFQGVDQRVFFGQTANVTAEITEIAAEHRRGAGRSDAARQVAGGVQAAHRRALFRQNGDPAGARRNPARRRSPDAHHPGTTRRQTAAGLRRLVEQAGPPEPRAGPHRRPERGRRRCDSARGACGPSTRSRSGSRRSTARVAADGGTRGRARIARRPTSPARCARPSRPSSFR